ncbi:MraY family glycosyltransferase [Treponema pedis]|uniref:MraY family glycosyltransferase n=1 Tax=Treponema pedis TaxID=409322 RepID=UPI00313417E6
MRLNLIQFIFYIMLLPCGISAALVCSIIRFSKKHNLYDETGGRKIHSGKISRLGGIGFTLAFLISFIILHFRFPHFRLLQSNFIYIPFASTIIFLMGILDDIKNSKPAFKLFIQSIAAFLVLYAGFRFTKISFAPLDIYINLGYTGYILTFLWIIGITNAMNLMDGIDGQAAGLSISLLISYSVIFCIIGVNNAIVYMNFLLVFALIGFLFFNLAIPNAKIFMGDCGSQFLGFTVAVLPLLHQKDKIETISIHFAAMFLMLPIFDTVAAIWRRVREKRPIGDGDKYHIHHKLMLMGFSSRKALAVFMLFQTIISVFVTIAVLARGGVALFILLGLILAGSLFFAFIHYKKEKIIMEKKVD